MAQVALAIIFLSTLTSRCYASNSTSVEPFPPHRGPTLSDELQCYSLPYGALGFVSHVLTYYALTMLAFGRSPWHFGLLGSNRWDLILAVLRMVGSVTMAAFTTSRCRETWPLLLVGVWKLLFSFEVGIWGVLAALRALRAADYRERAANNADHATPALPALPTFQERMRAPFVWSRRYRHEQEEYEMRVRKEREEYEIRVREEREEFEAKDAAHRNLAITAMMLVYAAPLAVGATGIITLVVRAWPEPLVWKVTVAFGVPIGVAFTIFMFCLVIWSFGRLEGQIALALIITGSCFLALFALYTDWALGALAKNLSGVPGGDNNVYYWIYFAVKRLPLLMS